MDRFSNPEPSIFRRLLPILRGHHAFLRVNRHAFDVCWPTTRDLTCMYSKELRRVWEISKTCLLSNNLNSSRKNQRIDINVICHDYLYSLIVKGIMKLQWNFVRANVSPIIWVITFLRMMHAVNYTPISLHHPLPRLFVIPNPITWKHIMNDSEVNETN